MPKNLLPLSDVRAAQQGEERVPFARELIEVLRGVGVVTTEVPVVVVGGSRRSSSSLSARTRKVIDTLPYHAQKIYSEAHKNALKQYESPSKRRGCKHKSKEQVAHKVAWSAVKKEYKKKGDKWVPKKISSLACSLLVRQPRRFLL